MSTPFEQARFNNTSFTRMMNLYATLRSEIEFQEAYSVLITDDGAISEEDVLQFRARVAVFDYDLSSEAISNAFATFGDA